jgi:tRNA-specific 2-thiouridylase
VLRKDVRANELVVSRDPRAPGTAARSIRFDSANWLDDAPAGASLAAQYRYHGPIITGVLSEDRDAFVPAEPLSEPVAAGQSIVFYAGNQCIGGGIIAADAAGA